MRARGSKKSPIDVFVVPQSGTKRIFCSSSGTPFLFLYFPELYKISVLVFAPRCSRCLLLGGEALGAFFGTVRRAGGLANINFTEHTIL